jgi:RHS repeat-associated protein
MPLRGYYAEGELVPGSPAQPYYYGPDQLGSVRRVFASATSAAAYGYDPYGNALQATAPVTDFGYAGMFRNADSGLYLTRYRAYDPAAGRWLSRDPVGEVSDPVGNLYNYAGGDPVSRIDPNGRQWQAIPLLIGAIGVAIYAIRQSASPVCIPRPRPPAPPPSPANACTKSDPHGTSNRPQYSPRTPQLPAEAGCEGGSEGPEAPEAVEIVE